MHELSGTPRSSTSTTARQLYAAGLNVIPLKRATKEGFKGWNKFRTTRLHNTYLTLFDDYPVNLAVITGHTSGHLVAFDCESKAAVCPRPEKRLLTHDPGSM